MGKIKYITNPYEWGTYQARKDHAIYAEEEAVERPYWYENIETGQLYYDIYACLAWPSEVTDSSDGLPGYAAIVGVVRPKKDVRNAKGANFQLLAEAQDRDVPSLIGKCLKLRDEYGFGITRQMLRVWIGDPDRFLTTLALMNEVLVENGDVHAVLVSPPDDFYVPKIFDIYVRAMRSVLLENTRRFYFGHNDILQNRLREFNKNDPCVLAMGGLVHSLLCRCTWMDQVGETAFNVEGENV